MSGGKSSSSSETNQNVWGPQAEILTQMYEHAPQLWSDMQGQMPGIQQGMSDWNQGVQDQSMAGWQDQMGGGNLGGYNIAGTLSGSLQNSMNNPTNMQNTANQFGTNNYADAYRQNFINDARSAIDTGLAATDGRAAASGMSGGSRHGLMQADALNNVNQNLQSNLANVGYQDYQSMANRQMQAAGAADQQTMQQQSMLQSLLGQQNSNNQYGLSQSGNMLGLGQGEMQAAMAPTNSYSQLMQAMGAPTVLSQSESTSKSAQGGL